MVTATFFFMGFAVCIFAGLICFALAKAVKTTIAVQLPPNERAAWNRLRIAITELHSRYENMETPRQRALRSWTGTLVICSGLCMIGILLETRYDRVISMKGIVSGMTGEQVVVPQQVEKHQPADTQNKPAPRTTRS